MSEQGSLRWLLETYEPAPAKHGALIRAAIRLADRLDIPARLVMNLLPSETEAGGKLFGLICDAIGVGHASLSDSYIPEFSLDDIPGSSEAYTWLVKLARACLNSLSTEFTREEALDIVDGIATIFEDISNLSPGEVWFVFDLETSRADWAEAFFR